MYCSSNYYNWVKPVEIPLHVLILPWVTKHVGCFMSYKVWFMRTCKSIKKAFKPHNKHQHQKLNNILYSWHVCRFSVFVSGVNKNLILQLFKSRTEKRYQRVHNFKSSPNFDGHIISAVKVIHIVLFPNYHYIFWWMILK